MKKLLGCSIHSYCTPKRKELVRHVWVIYKHNAKFLVHCNQCSRFFTKVASFKKHMSRSSECRKFSQVIMNEGVCTSILAADANLTDLLDLDVLDNPRQRSTDFETQLQPMKWRAAAFLFSVKERHLLSEAAGDTIVLSTTFLVGSILNSVLTE